MVRCCQCSWEPVLGPGILMGEAIWSDLWPKSAARLYLSILFIKLSASEWQLSKCLRVLLLPEQAWVCGRFQVLRVGGVSLERHGQAWSRGEDFFTLTFLMQCLDLLCGLKAMSTDMAQEQGRPSSAWQRTSESLEGTYQSISEVIN